MSKVRKNTKFGQSRRQGSTCMYVGLQRAREGLTLIEMLLVCVMVSVVGVVLYVMLANGIGVWQRVTKESPELNMNLFFEKIAEDLRNCFFYETIPFFGQENSLSFATVFKISPQESGFQQEVGRVGYFYEKSSKTLHREEANLSQVSSLYTSAMAEQLMQNLGAFSFKYYYFDKEKNDFFWLKSWPPEGTVDKRQIGLPQAVRIELIFQEGKIEEKHIKTINIPCGG